MRVRDYAFGEDVNRRPRGLGIRTRPTAPHAPKQNAYLERLTGSIRRECFDHAMVLSETPLCRIMFSHADYYNQACAHLVLRKHVPVGRCIERIVQIIVELVDGELHHHNG